MSTSHRCPSCNVGSIDENCWVCGEPMEQGTPHNEPAPGNRYVGPYHATGAQSITVDDIPSGATWSETP